MMIRKTDFWPNKKSINSCYKKPTYKNHRGKKIWNSFHWVETNPDKMDMRSIFSKVRRKGNKVKKFYRFVYDYGRAFTHHFSSVHIVEGPTYEQKTSRFKGNTLRFSRYENIPTKKGDQ